MKCPNIPPAVYHESLYETCSVKSATTMINIHRTAWECRAQAYLFPRL